MGPARFSIDIKDLKDLKRPLGDDARGCLSPALREHRDREVSPTGMPSRPGGLSYGDALILFFDELA